MKKGDLVQDFELQDQEGTPRKLSDFLATGPVVLFFYPGAMTPGCTVEACHFRDMASEFKAVGAHRVGISKDLVSKQKQFSDKYDFDYPVLSDETGEISERFGISSSINPLKSNRKTFVIGTDSTVLTEIETLVSMNAHADKALEFLNNMGRDSVGLV